LSDDEKSKQKLEAKSETVRQELVRRTEGARTRMPASGPVEVNTK
jgi:hypothetical protein